MPIGFHYHEVTEYREQTSQPQPREATSSSLDQKPKDVGNTKLKEASPRQLANQLSGELVKHMSDRDALILTGELAKYVGSKLP